MDATQMISDSILESDEEENEELNENKRGRPLAKLCILKNQHFPETELPLFLGDNVLGRDPNTCTLLMPAPSISKQHATIHISVYRKRGSHSEVDIEALVWDLGSMNGIRKGRLKLTPNVRYALSECDSLVVADIPCQYVSCTGDAVFSQRDVRTPVSRNSGARLLDASEEKGGDTGTGSKKCVNGGTKARVSLPDQKDTRKTPVRASCLSFEQTPTQPQGTLVPESDSESDGERGDKRSKALVSDSDSHKSSPACSTFLSPTNKIVPESEDESLITPSSSTKNRPCRHVSFSQEEIDVDVGRQQLKNKKTLAIVGDGEEEEERAALGGRKSEESGQHVSVKQESNVSLRGEVELPVSTPAAFTNAIPAFGMDSDTDMEGEEEGVASAGPVTLNTNQQADQLPNTAQFHMDSDTDADEDDEVSHTVPKSVASSADHIKPPHVISVIQPEGITMDSDTDVDDDDDDDDDAAAAAAVSDAAIKAKPSSLQSTHAADSSSTQLNDLHLDRQTDVDDEEEKECGTNNACLKIDEIPTRSDIKPTEPESTPAAPHSLHLDSDTDDEAIPAPAISEPSIVSAVTELTTAADAVVALGVLSDSDTDVENDCPLVIPVAASTVSVGPGTMSQALQSDSDADTDVDESSVPPAGDVVNPPDLRVDRDTDVEDEVDFGEAGEGQIPSLHRENTPGLLVPLQQNCSTPVQLSEGELENMETQVFLCPSSRSFRCPIAPAAGAIALSSCSDSQEDDFVVAETQSFILQTRECQGNPPADHTMDPTQSSGDEKGELSIRGRSFQLGLSDSSHLEAQAQALAMESTQAFVSVVGGLNLEDTQVYAAVSNADRTSLEKDLNLEAYGQDKEPARCSVMSAKEGQVDLALEATQAYISEPYSDSEDETDEDERKNTAAAETQPFDFPTSSILAIAETQPMSAFEEESLDKGNPISSALQVKPRLQNVTEEREEHGEAAQPLKRHLSEALSVAETQPMCVSEDEESDDEDLIPVPRQRKAKPLQLEEEQTQTLTNSELSLVEMQPMTASGDVENYVGDSISGPRKRKAKRLWFEDEQTQALTNSELPTVETWPTLTGEDGESDEEDSIVSPRKRRAKPLRLEDETQPLTSSEEVLAVETQPMGTCEGEQGDEEDSIPGPRKRKAKALQLEEEETQPLVSAVETQPMVTGEDRESDDRDSNPGPRKRKAKPQQIQEEETQPPSTGEIRLMETKTRLQPQRGKGRLSEAGTSGTTIGGRRETRARFREEEEQAECSEPPKRQTRRKTKALPTTRGRRGKLRPDDEESEEEEYVEQPKQARGKKSTRQQKDNEEEEERLETERSKHIENNNRLKEQEEEGREEQDKLERERKQNKEQERVQAENAERLRLEQERIERERMEQEEKKRADRAQKEKEKQLERERKEMEEKERLERVKVDREEKERIEKERKEEEKERLERERADREEKERIEKERKEEEKERLERERADREEKERKEKEEKERLEREKVDREEKERIEKERKVKEEKERLEREKVDREEKERIEKERKEKEEKERLEHEKVDREEKERMEKERKEKEEKERLEHERADREEKERIEKERKEKEEKERLERERAEREEKERKKEEKERLKTAKREREERFERERNEQEHQTRLEREAKEREEGERLEKAKQEKDAKEKQMKEQQENKPKTPARGRRAARRTFGAPVTSEPERDSAVTANDDVPARRTRSRSNSSNSVSSERSASSVNTQGSRGSGRGRGAKRTSGPQQDGNDISPQGVLSRSNSEISSCSLSSQSRGRGGRQRGRGRKSEAEPDYIPPTSRQRGQNLAPKPPARGRRSSKAEECSNEVPHEDDVEKADAQQASTTRGRQLANANGSEPAAGDNKAPSSQECGSEESPLSKRTVRGRGQKAVKSETVEVPVAPSVSDGDECKEKRKGRKRDLEASTEESASSSSKISKEKAKAQTTEAAEEETKGETKDEIRVQAKRRGRASGAQAKLNPKDPPTEWEVKEESEKMKEGTVERRGRGRPSAVQKKKKEEQDESGTSVDQDPHVEPQTPTGSASRKRQAPANSSCVAKTPRSSSSSSASPTASQAHKVLFTGLVDEEGERALARLGGSKAKGVADMNCLVTDKVRRTVKFLCALAKGVPIVTTHWLEKSGKAGSFLPPNAFVVKDPEQEKKFNFCLQESLRIASSQPLLQGYEIHVTKSVQPEPVHMKDIISCSGATFLAKMPSCHKPQTVVISCEDDWPLCRPALSASLPVVTAEFILTGILQQKLDLQTHTLSSPANTLQPAGGRGRSRKKT